MQKLSRRQKKKLKQASAINIETTAAPKSQSQVIAIDRSQLFYCTSNLNPSTGTVTMKLPKDRKKQLQIHTQCFSLKITAVFATLDILKRGKSSNLDNELVYCMSKIFPHEFVTPNKRVSAVVFSITTKALNSIFIFLQKRLLKRSCCIQELIKTLQIKHSKIHFQEALERRCPKKVLQLFMCFP